MLPLPKISLTKVTFHPLYRYILTLVSPFSASFETAFPISSMSRSAKNLFHAFPTSTFETSCVLRSLSRTISSSSRWIWSCLDLTALLRDLSRTRGERRVGWGEEEGREGRTNGINSSMLLLKVCNKVGDMNDMRMNKTDDWLMPTPEFSCRRSEKKKKKNRERKKSEP